MGGKRAPGTEVAISDAEACRLSQPTPDDCGFSREAMAGKQKTEQTTPESKVGGVGRLETKPPVMDWLFLAGCEPPLELVLPGHALQRRSLSGYLQDASLSSLPTPGSLPGL